MHDGLLNFLLVIMSFYIYRLGRDARLSIVSVTHLCFITPLEIPPFWSSAVTYFGGNGFDAIFSNNWSSPKDNLSRFDRCVPSNLKWCFTMMYVPVWLVGL